MSTRGPAANIKLKRAYEPPAPKDDSRILIDRLRARGISKKEAAPDQWMKYIAPSTELGPARWEEFRRRYAKEILCNALMLDQLCPFSGPITLVYSTRDDVENDPHRAG